MSRQLFGGGRWESNELDLSIGAGNSPVAAEGGFAVSNLKGLPGADLNRFAFLQRPKASSCAQFAHRGSSLAFFCTKRESSMTYDVLITAVPNGLPDVEHEADTIRSAFARRQIR